MGLGREHAQEALDPSRPGPMYLCAWMRPWMVLAGGGGVDVAGVDVAGRDVAREEWGKWLVFVVSLDRVSCRRMCEGCHPVAGVGLGMKGREGVERWGRWVKKGGQGVCVGNGAMRYRVLMEEAIISPTTAALWL